MPIRLKIIDVNEDRPAIFDVTEMMDFPSPKSAVQQAVSINGLPFHQPEARKGVRTLFWQKRVSR